MLAQTAYDELIQKVKEAATLSSVGGLLEWDQQSYMPSGAGKFRADQLSLVAGLSHKKFTDPRIGELLSELEATGLGAAGDTPEAANVRELRHQYDKATKLPGELVSEWARTVSLAQDEWVGARKHNDFKRFLPWLEKVMDLCRRKAQAYGCKSEPYDALLDEYEPGASAAELVETFASLRQDLGVLLEKIRNAPRRPNAGVVERPYDVQLQRVFGESVAAAMGFDFTRGRLDTTPLPFCTGIGPNDVRILTRYNPNRLSDSFFGIMHEAGHALYEMGIEKEANFGAPMGEAASLGVHESQSRMWENLVGRSRPFWKYFFPQAQRLFKDALRGVSLDAFYGAVNDVKPSHIRVEADEGTYNLHIILRFELERALLLGDLKPADVPGEWNTRFKKYLGLEVDKDSNGCLQDVHWSAGLVGYFPTYTLGNLYSAQLFQKARKDMPDLDSHFERGEFAPLREWLRDNIHRHGRRYRSGDLCARVTGKPLTHKPFIDYLNSKYAEIYGF